MPQSQPAEPAPSGSASHAKALDILFVCTDLLIGGTERQLAALASALVGQGWRINVYSLAGRGPMQAEFERGGVPLIFPPLTRPAKTSPARRVLALALLVPHLLFVMLKQRPAIVHFFLPEAYLVGTPLAWLARIKIKIMSRRSLNLYQKSAPIRAIERRWHRGMDAVLGNSRSVIAELRDEGVPSERLGLIYNGINTAGFADANARPMQRAALNIEPNAFVMIIVANLIPYKGHSDLIDALAIAMPKLPPAWRLLVVGRDDGIGAELQEQVKRLGLEIHVLFLGVRTDIAVILGASDVGILCSHQEGFSNAILEVMAAGLPVIATNVGGNPEAVIEGETGLIVPARNPQGLAAAIVRLAGDPALRDKFGKAGQDRVTRQFSMQNFAQTHRKLYTALLAARRPVDVPEICVGG